MKNTTDWRVDAESRRYHESLDSDHYLMTPYEAFWTRLPEECKLNMFLERMESELNAGK